MANQQFDERDFKYGGLEFRDSDGTNILDVITATPGPWRVDAVFLANFDSIDHTMLVGLNNGARVGPMAVVPLPAAVAGVPSRVEVISTAFAVQQSLILPGLTQLSFQLIEAVTDSSTPVSVTYLCGTL